jgi:hypothetical protein
LQDDAAARIYLTEALGYLDAASHTLSSDVQAKVDDLRKQVVGLEQALAKGEADSYPATTFNEVEAHLRGLIRQL